MRLQNLINYKLYVDLDGVITDFVRQFEEYFGMGDPWEFRDNFGQEKLWDLLKDGGLEYWTEMPWMPDGRKLWNKVKSKNPTILTSPAKPIPECYAGKRIWVERELGVPVIIDGDKYNYSSPTSILIDDKDYNVYPWIEAGGIGILHENADKTIKQLRRIGIL